jgi:hypothetical protein
MIYLLLGASFSFLALPCVSIVDFFSTNTPQANATAAMDDASFTAGFKGLSCIVYFLNIIACIVFMSSNHHYMSILIGIYTMILSTLMLLVAAQKPAMFMEKANASAEFLFTYKGRVIVDTFIVLFLFGMHGFGVAMGIIMIILILGVRLIAAQYPASFNELFRAGDQAAETFDSP